METLSLLIGLKISFLFVSELVNCKLLIDVNGKIYLFVNLHKIKNLRKKLIKGI